MTSKVKDMEMMSVILIPRKHGVAKNVYIGCCWDF